MLYIICRRRRHPRRWTRADFARWLNEIRLFGFCFSIEDQLHCVCMFPDPSGRGVGKGLSKSHPVVHDRIMAFSVTWFGWRKIIILFRYNTLDKSIDFVRILNFSLNWKYYHDKTNLFCGTIRWINLTTVKTALSLNYIEDLDKKI